MDKILSKFAGCLIVRLSATRSARARRVAKFVEVADLALGTLKIPHDHRVAESLAECKDFHYWHMAERLLKKYEQEPWRRYGHTITRVFRLMRTANWDSDDRPGHLYGRSYGNGAAVR